MTRARYLVGDVFDRLAEIPDGTVDLVMTSPPFLALRSYLPAGHPDKHKEIGSEATPADFLDTLLALTAEWGRVLAPHGSICVELGDTYAGSGGAGGDYGPDGLRAGQPKFRSYRGGGENKSAPGWPLDKSLTGIPTLYAWSLAYGRNLLRAPMSARELLAIARETVDMWAADGREITVTELLDYLESYLTAYEERGPTLAYEQWRIRNLVAWVRPNPSVGALGDKFRPATSYLTIACRARDRWFDLDAVRTAPNPANERGTLASNGKSDRHTERSATGAPPLDWWNHTDMLIDNEIAERAGKVDNYQRTTNGPKVDGRDGTPRFDSRPPPGAVGAQGSHIRRRLEQAGYLGGPTDDVWDIAPSGYPGAHFAVYPPELCVRPILAMCPRRVCTTCGEPSRRIVGEAEYVNSKTGKPTTTLHFDGDRRTDGENHWDTTGKGDRAATRVAPTLGWSDCGHNSWRPGHVLDPFAGTGTTLAVATGHGREATGIDIDPRNAQLAQQRLGMFLDINDNPTTEPAA